MAKIGIVTVLYNSASVLEAYFKSLSEQTCKNFILFVVDNKSPDNSLTLVERLALEYSSEYETKIIKNDDNYGVAKGNNIGICRAKAAGCDYILLSNNDIELKNDCIEKLLYQSETYGMDMVVPKIYFYDEPLIWYAGGDFKWVSGTIRQWGYLSKDEKSIYSKCHLVDYAPTCFMLVKMKVFNEVGLFDEKYFVYYDDTDWVYRCKKAKKNLLYYPETCIWHKESTSTGGMRSDFYLHYAKRNQVYFCRKNFGLIHLAIVFVANLFYYGIKSRFQYTVRQRQIIEKAYLEGLKMNINE